MKTNNSKGFVLIESTFVLSAAIGLFSTLLVYLYFGFALVWLDHLTYEYLVCIEEEKPRPTCENNFRKIAKISLPWGKINYFKNLIPKEARLEYEILNQKLHIQKKLTL